MSECSARGCDWEGIGMPYGIGSEKILVFCPEHSGTFRHVWVTRKCFDGLRAQRDRLVVLLRDARSYVWGEAPADTLVDEIDAAIKEVEKK